MIGKKENLLPMNVPIDRGNLGRKSSDARQLGCAFQDMTLAKSIIQKCRSQSNVWGSQRLLHVTPKFETKILRSDILAQMNLISAAPMLQNLRIGLRKRRNGKSKVPVKQRGSWPKVCLKLKIEKQEQHSSHLRKKGACLHQILNLRKENLLSTPERQCT